MASGEQRNEIVAVAKQTQLSATLDGIVEAATALNTDDLLGLLSFNASHTDCTILSLGYALALARHYALDVLKKVRDALQNQPYVGTAPSQEGNTEEGSKETGLANILRRLLPVKSPSINSPQPYNAHREAYLQLGRAAEWFSALHTLDDHLPEGLSSRGRLAGRISEQLKSLATQLVPNADVDLMYEVLLSASEPINPDWLYKIHDDAVRRGLTGPEYGRAILDYIRANTPSGRTSEAQIVPV